jgi:3-oxoacyl-[acyl-carrier protein] reductase
MDLQLAGKRCLVSGASRGIGRAIALALHAEGAQVTAVARGQADLDTLPAEIEKVVADVATADGADRATAGGFDVVVCNVGKSFARSVQEMDDGDLERSLDANLWTAVRVAKRAIPAMIARGGGAILMISSIWGREAGGAPGYNATKAAVIAMAKAIARDHAKDNIRCNSLAPGSILFPGGGWDRKRVADPEGIAAFVARDLPFGRFGSPEEIADVATFLCSPRARWISGACVVVDGAQSHAF